MQRATLVWTMDKGARIWLYNTARKHYWRVANWYDVDDLVQDGQWLFQRVINKYPRIHNRAQIMALFKSAFINHLHNLSKKRTNHTALLAVLQVEHNTGDPSTQIPEDAIRQMAREPELAATLRQFIQNPPEDLTADLDNINKHLCKLLGIRAKVDMVEALREIFA